jgi:hypothetical protein
LGDLPLHRPYIGLIYGAILSFNLAIYKYPTSQVKSALQAFGKPPCKIICLEKTIGLLLFLEVPKK